MRLLSVLIPLVCLAALSASAEPEQRVVSGYYTIGWEEQSFRPCGERGRWWVSNPGPLMEAYRDLVEPEYGTLFVTVRVELTDEGNWGHLGQYRRAAAVLEVFDARLPSPERDDCARVKDAE